MSTTCFYGEIRKISTMFLVEKSVLYGAMMLLYENLYS